MSRRFKLFGEPRYARHSGGIEIVELLAEEEGDRLRFLRAEQAARNAAYSQMCAEEEERVAPPSPLSSYGSDLESLEQFLEDDAAPAAEEDDEDSPPTATSRRARTAPRRHTLRGVCPSEAGCSTGDVDMENYDDNDGACDLEEEETAIDPAACLLLDERSPCDGDDAITGRRTVVSSFADDSTCDPSDVLGCAQPWTVNRDAGVARLRWLGRDTDPAELRGSALDVPLPTWKRLFPHQRIGVSWLWKHTCEAAANRSFGAILADEMGLGKTVQVLTFLESVLYNRYGRTALLVVPSTLVASWQAHQETWCPRLRMTALTADTPLSLRARIVDAFAAPNHAAVLLTTYGMLQSMAKRDQLLNRVHWDYIVLDEGHIIKNPASQTAKATKALRGNVRYILTGTPFQNTLDELWALYSFVDSTIFNCSAAHFKQTYTDPVRRGLLKGASENAVADGTRASTTLKELYAPFMLQRSKDCLPQSQQQKKVDVVVWCRMSDLQQKVYSQYLNGQDVKECVRRREVPGAICMLTNLRKLCNHLWLQYPQAELHHKVLTPSEGTEQGSIAGDCCKMEVLLRIFSQARAGGHRLLIFSQSAKMLTIITAVLRAVFPDTQLLRLDGTTRPRDRQARVDRFNQDKTIDAMLLTTGVGGTGLNLTGASRVVIFDPDWNPAKDSQAIGRAHRIGQTSQVVVYRLMTCGGVEEYTYRQAIFKECVERKTQHSQNDLRRYFTKVDLHSMFHFNPSATHTLHQLKTLEGDRRYPPDVDAVFAAVRAEAAVQGLTDHDAVFDASCTDPDTSNTSIDTVSSVLSGASASTDGAADVGAMKAHANVNVFAPAPTPLKRPQPRNALLPSDTPHARRGCEEDKDGAAAEATESGPRAELSARPETLCGSSSSSSSSDTADIAETVLSPVSPVGPAQGELPPAAEVWGGWDGRPPSRSGAQAPFPTPNAAPHTSPCTPAVAGGGDTVRPLDPPGTPEDALSGSTNTPPARDRGVEALFARSSPSVNSMSQHAVGGSADGEDGRTGRCYSSSQPRDKDDREMLKAAEEAFSTLQHDTPVRLGLPPRHTLGAKSPAVVVADPPARCPHCDFGQYPFCPVTGRAHGGKPPQLSSPPKGAHTAEPAEVKQLRHGGTPTGHGHARRGGSVSAVVGPPSGRGTPSVASAKKEVCRALSMSSHVETTQPQPLSFDLRTPYTVPSAVVEAGRGQAEDAAAPAVQRASLQSSSASWGWTEMAGDCGRSIAGYASCVSGSTEPQSTLLQPAEYARGEDDAHEHSLEMSQDTEMESDEESATAAGTVPPHAARPPRRSPTREAMPPPVGSFAFATTPNARAPALWGAGDAFGGHVLRRSASRSCSEPGLATGNLTLMTPECRGLPHAGFADGDGWASAPDAPHRCVRESSASGGYSTTQREMSFSSGWVGSQGRRSTSAQRSVSDPGPGLVLPPTDGSFPPAMRCSMHLGTMKECAAMTPEYSQRTPACDGGDGRRGSAPHAPMRHIGAGARQGSDSGGSSSGWQPRELRFSASQHMGRASSASSGTAPAAPTGLPRQSVASMTNMHTPRVMGLCYQTPDPRIPPYGYDITPGNPPPPAFHAPTGPAGSGLKETPVLRCHAFSVDSDGQSAPDAPLRPRRAVSGSGGGCSSRSSMSRSSSGYNLGRRETLFAGGDGKSPCFTSTTLRRREYFDEQALFVHPFHPTSHDRTAREMSLGSSGSGGDGAHAQFFTITDPDAVAGPGGAGGGSPQPPPPPGRPRLPRDTVRTSISTGSAQRELLFADSASSCGGGPGGIPPAQRGAWCVRDSLLTCQSAQSPAPIHPFYSHETPECSWTLHGPPGAPARGPGSGSAPGYVPDRACSLSSNAFISPVTRMGGIRRRIHTRGCESEASCFSHDEDDELLHMPARSESASTEDSYRIRHSIVMYTPPPI